MESNPTTNPPTDPEAEPTMRALDPFFETDEMRDHANQWQLAAIWKDKPETPKPLETDLR
jgi:hypothetical protein